MATNRTVLIDLRDRLLACGAAVPAQAAAFHRERASLLAEVAGALSWRGGLGLGQSGLRLVARVDALAARGESLQGLFGRVGQVEQQLVTVARALERIAAPTLRDPGAIPARLEELSGELRRLGRRVQTDDDLLADEQSCAAAGAASARLAEALDLWRSAEEALTRIRASTRTAVLEAALPELGERLCQAGPTPQWQAELKALVDPLDALAHREPPREIAQIERIIRALPRWARALGEDGDAGAALAERFKARRKDWPAEDDHGFRELFAQARALEQGLVERAAASRADGIADLAARCALFADLVGPDPGLDERVADLRAEAPADPRDHEDWCAQLRDADVAFQHRVKRSETVLLATFSDLLDDCRQRLAALTLIPRLEERDAQLARLRDHCDGLRHAGQGFDALALLGQVALARALRGDLESLEGTLRQDQVDLDAARGALQRRAQWLGERARVLAITPSMPLPDLAPRADQGGGAAGSESGRASSLEPVRRQLEQQQRSLGAAEAEFVRVCREEIESGQQRLAQALAVLAPERIGATGLDLAPLPPAAAGDLGGLADDLERVRTRLVGVQALLADEEQALRGRAAQTQEALALLPPERLGHHDRSDREALLRQFAQWRPDALPDPPSDPLARIAALRQWIENAELIERRVVAAARRLRERRAALGERLRTFNALLLQGYCPDLYLRVEALVHPPAATRWPPGAEAAQVQEAERLLRLLERQAQRLAAQEIAATVQTLERHARRTADAESTALLAQLRALPPDQQPPARLRRRLADQVAALGLEDT